MATFTAAAPATAPALAVAALLVVLVALIVAPSLPLRGEQQKAVDAKATPKPQTAQSRSTSEAKRIQRSRGFTGAAV